jgi:hypothetical protein
MRRRLNALMTRVRLLPSLFLAVLLPACTGGIDAGVDGGVAFIAFTVMLIVFAALLWWAIGRED